MLSLNASNINKAYSRVLRMDAQSLIWATSACNHRFNYLESGDPFKLSERERFAYSIYQVQIVAASSHNVQAAKARLAERDPRLVLQMYCCIELLIRVKLNEDIACRTRILENVLGERWGFVHSAIFLFPHAAEH